MTRSSYNWCGHSLSDLRSPAGLVNILRQSSSSPTSLSPSLSALSLHTNHTLVEWVAHCTKVIGSIPEDDRKGTPALQGVHCAQGTSMICMHWSSLSLGQSRPKDHCLSLTGAQTDLFEKVIIFHHFTYMWSEDKMCKTDRHTQKGARFCSDIFPLHTDRQISSSIREADLSKKCSFF